VLKNQLIENGLGVLQMNDTSTASKSGTDTTSSAGNPDSPVVSR
jgi:predicted Zn-dependent protease